jgi:hypothetical protein
MSHRARSIDSLSNNQACHRRDEVGVLVLNGWVASIRWARVSFSSEYCLCHHLSNVVMLFGYRPLSNQTGHYISLIDCHVNSHQGCEHPGIPGVIHTGNNTWDIEYKTRQIGDH